MNDEISSVHGVVIPENDGVVEIPLQGGDFLYFDPQMVDAIKSATDRSILFFNIEGDAATAISSLDPPEMIGWLIKRPQPIICGVEGDVFDSGLELAMACDIRVASHSALFGFTQIARGQTPRNGGIQLLSRLVGPGIALDMLLTGRELSGGEALERGLVNYLSDDPAKTAREIARTIAGHGNLASKYVKEAVNAA